MSSGTFLRITQFKERGRSASYSVGEIGGFDLNTLHSVCPIVFWAHSTFMKLTSLGAVSSGSWTMHLHVQYNLQNNTTIVQCAFSKPVMLQIIDIGSSYCRARYLSLDLSSVDYLALFTLHLHCLQLILHSVFDVQLFKTLHYLWATNSI